MTSEADNRPEKLIPVCAECLRACCVAGEFYCDNAKTADIVYKRRDELEALDLESSHYWEGRFYYGD